MNPASSDKSKIEQRRLYGRRSGKKLRPSRQALFETLLPRLRIDVAGQVTGSLDPTSLFDPQIGEVWLEIGFGGGEHLIAQAEANPNIGIIGCEPFTEGIGKVLAEIAQKNITNIRLYDDDARFLLDVLEPACLTRLFLLFPDPWPKKRHNKRRFVNDETVAQVARVLVIGGAWRMATDIMDYARWMLTYMTKSSDFVWTAEDASDWRRRPDDWTETRYEQKARAQGRNAVYLTFLRTK